MENIRLFKGLLQNQVYEMGVQEKIKNFTWKISGFSIKS
jgi:hypothetical protein